MKPHPDQHYGNHFYSQNGEDIVVLNIFNQMFVSYPSYLDIGAHHPHIISNTALLYERGCKGINIEANPNLIEEFYRFRPRDININAGIMPSSGTKKLMMYDKWSGRNTFSGKEVDEVSTALSLKITDQIEVDCITINQLVKEIGDWPSFLSIDIEGMDYEVLESAEFEKTSPLVICVECRFDDQIKFMPMMRDKGFFPYCRLGENVIFCQKLVLDILQRDWF